MSGANEQVQGRLDGADVGLERVEAIQTRAERVQSGQPGWNLGALAGLFNAQDDTTELAKVAAGPINAYLNVVSIGMFCGV